MILMPLLSVGLTRINPFAICEPLARHRSSIFEHSNHEIRECWSFIISRNIISKHGYFRLLELLHWAQYYNVVKVYHI